MGARRVPICALVAGLVLLALLGSGGPVLAEPESRYGPVPPGIDGIISSERDRALAAMGIATLESGKGARDLSSAALLVMLGDAGLKAVATRLARGAVPTNAIAPLLEVVAASRHAEADILLARAAGEPRPILRVIAADGLGRGRSPRAVPALAALALDDVPGVRIAALRALFAIETPQAVAARTAVPADPEPDLLAARLRWHRRCADVAPELRAAANRAYRSGRTVALRMEAASYLVRPESQASTEALELILREMGGDPLTAAVFRWGNGLPGRGYDRVAERRIAIDAALTLLSRPDLPAAKRALLIDQSLGWVAQPVAMDPYRRDPIPEYRLRRLLPDLGAEILSPLVRRLRRGDFAVTRQGMILLRELGAELAVPVLRDLVRPRTERPPFESRAEAAERRYLRNAAAGALQELGQVGDEQLARALVLGDEQDTLKIDILHALETEPGAWAVALLGEVVASGDLELRSYALDILERRGGPEARKILVDDLFARMDRPYDRLRPLVARGDEPALEVVRRALKDERSYMRKQASTLR